MSKINNIYINNKLKLSKTNENSAVSFSSNGDSSSHISSELASKECACATRATAMAQILTGNNFSYNTTLQEYTDALVKQGKVPDKDFYVENQKNSDSNFTNGSVYELNSNNQIAKETRFIRDNKCSGSWNEQVFYNTAHNFPYKSITYQDDGKVVITNVDLITKRAVDYYEYRADGSLEYHRDIKDNQGRHFAINGEITYFQIEDEHGHFNKPKYDDFGNLISE